MLRDRFLTGESVHAKKIRNLCEVTKIYAPDDLRVWWTSRDDLNLEKHERACHSCDNVSEKLVFDWMVACWYFYAKVHHIPR